ncbi:prepilin peptidase [Blastococcus tunisiensis]|uniref:Leader peptidase (Prepilin peptidase) / N-methyltransferase n=1 Tax=Blastococcus tunisiensis TaxID=1798228 RepID=A0A1I2HNC9_9ACTN|nr:A24 family peptidase [Blastococcus sp. DSM 46838]SFF30337.1 leader peptidase (prepilin peptidase) / N-methyltransferase [Blastococcus sp. DSM 46838]
MLVGAALLVALIAGPLLARVAVRLASGDAAARPTAARVAVMTAVLAGLLAGSVALLGLRPGTAALAWAAGAAVVLGAVDLLSHRLPDRVTYPAVAVCAAAFLVDALVLGTWPALLRSLLVAVVSFAVGVGAAMVSPDGFGFGDVKLLGLLGLVLGWFGWGVLLTGVFLGLLTGALVSLVLLATRRVGWRSAIPFGPPLLTGAVLVLALGAVSLT